MAKTEGAFTFSLAAHEDDYSSATDKLFHPVAYFLVGKLEFISVNGAAVHPEEKGILSLPWLANWPDRNISGPSTVVKSFYTVHVSVGKLDKAHPVTATGVSIGSGITD